MPKGACKFICRRQPSSFFLVKTDPRRNELGTVGAFGGFVQGPNGDDDGKGDGYPDEFVVARGLRRAAVALGACAARSLRVWFRRGGVENDAIGGAFGDLAHVVLDGDAQRGANALDQKFPGIQNRELSDGGQVRIGTNYCRRDTENKSLGVGGGEDGRAGGEDRGRPVIFLSLRVALLELESNRRAAPTRIWRLPAGSVRNLSPEKTVVPAEAFPASR